METEDRAEGPAHDDGHLARSVIDWGDSVAGWIALFEQVLGEGPEKSDQPKLIDFICTVGSLETDTA